MKKLLFTLLFMTITVCGNASTGSKIIIGPTGNGEILATNFANFSTAVHSPSVAGYTVLVTTPMSCNTVTVPSNVGVHVIQGGSISVAGTLTISGPFSAGSYQVFQGGGTVYFSTPGQVVDVRLFGATPGDLSRDQSTAFQNAATAVSLNGGMVYFAGGFYPVNIILDTRNVTLKSDSAGGINNVITSGLIPWDTTKPVVTVGSTANPSYIIGGVTLENIYVSATSPASTYGTVGILYTSGAYESRNNNISVAGAFSQYSVLLQPSSASNANSVSKVWFTNAFINNTGTGTALAALSPTTYYTNQNFISAIHFSGEIVGPSTGSGYAAIVQSGAVKFTATHMQVQPNQGLDLIGGALGNAYVDGSNLTIDCSTSGSVLVTTNEATLVPTDVLNGHLSVNGKISNGTSTFDLSTGVKDFLYTYNQITYPYVHGKIFFQFYPTYVDQNVNCGRSGNNLLCQNNTTGYMDFMTASNDIYFDAGTIHARKSDQSTSGQWSGGQYTMVPIASSGVSHYSIFVDSGNSNALSYKDGSGNVHTINLTP